MVIHHYHRRIAAKRPQLCVGRRLAAVDCNNRREDCFSPSSYADNFSTNPCHTRCEWLSVEMQAIIDMVIHHLIIITRTIVQAHGL